MKVKVPLLLLLLLAGAIGYLLGTEDGRTRRDVILVKLGRKEADDTGDLAQPAAESEPAADAEPAADDATAPAPA